MHLDEFVNQFSNSVSHRKSRAYLIGLGPSLSLFDSIDFQDAYTLALNGSWRRVSADAVVTIHPLETFEKIPEADFSKIPKVIFVGKEKWAVALKALKEEQPHLYDYIQGSVNVVEFQYRIRDDRVLPFESQVYGRCPQFLGRARGNFLYVWSSISQTGLHLLFRLGYRNISMVACEANEHASRVGAIRHFGATRWNGVPPSYRLGKYAVGNIEVAEVLRSLGAKITTLSPLVTLNSRYASLEFESRAPNVKSVDRTNRYVKLRNSAYYILNTVFGRKFTLVLSKKLSDIKKMFLYNIKSSPVFRQLLANAIYYYLKFLLVRGRGAGLKRYGNYYLPVKLDCEGSTILSFGIGNDLSFERSLLESYSDLDILIADPTPAVVTEIFRIQKDISECTSSTSDFKWKSTTGPVERIIRKVRFEPLGVCDRNCSLEFFSKPNGLNSSTFRLNNSSAVQTVQLKDIAEFFAEAPRAVSVVKLDVEGMAPTVIHRMLDRKFDSQVIVGEFEIFAIGETLTMARDALRVVKRLRRRGYKIYRTIANHKKTIEFVCIPAT